MGTLPKPLADLISGRDDADLLVGLRRRDPEAAGLLYDRYGKSSYSLALRILGDPAAAENVVAEAVLKCWNRAASFPETRGSAVGVWLLMTAYSTAMDHRKAREAVTDEWSAQSRWLESAALFEDWSRALDMDHIQALFWELYRLPAQERRLLDLAFIDGLNRAELTAWLGGSRADLDKLIASALGKLSIID